MDRRLTAILAADVAGYSRHTARQDESSTATLRERLAVVKEVVAAHKGRIFTTAGDGVVAEFLSVVEAIRCAVEIQREIALRNASVPESERMQFRIGVNLGDVISQDKDLYGTGVNVAARLEQLALPGGICVSQTVYDQVRTIVEIPFQDIGEHRLKNIPDPIRVYRILSAPLPWYVSFWSHSKNYLRRPEVAALVFLLILAVSGGASYYLRQPAVLWTTLLSNFANSATIAVLPFENLSGNPDQRYFSDGLTEDIMTQLARGSRDLHVLARNTTFQYKDKPVDVRTLGRELGARYVLEGSVQRASPDPEGLSRNADVRVTARLIDAQNGTDIWSAAFDRNMADIFLIQDEIVGEIVAKIAGGYGAIERSERESAARKSPKEIQAYDLVLRARQAMQWGWTADAFTSANEFLLQAIALDPANAQARREQAYINVFGRIFEYLESPMSLHESTAQALKAVQLDPANARAHMVAAIAYFFGKQLDLFEHEAQQAMALAPHDAEILAHLGALIGYTGQWQRGVKLVKHANKLNEEAAVGWYHSTVYLDAYLRGDYEEALSVLKQSPDYQPDFEQSSFYAYLDSVPILAQLGRVKESSENWDKLRKKRPGWSINDFENWFRTWNFRDDDIVKLRDGVYKSGVLEKTSILQQ